METYFSFFTVQVSLPELEVKAGLALQPQALEVSVVDRPLTDLLFTQFMASVSGKVYCLGEDRFLYTSTIPFFLSYMWRQPHETMRPFY